MAVLLVRLVVQVVVVETMVQAELGQVVKVLQAKQEVTTQTVEVVVLLKLVVLMLMVKVEMV